MCLHLVIEHGKRMRRSLLSCVASLAPPYFSTSSHHRQDFRKKVTENEMCLIFYTTVSETFLILKRIQRYCHKLKNVFMYSTRHSCHILIKLYHSRHGSNKKKFKYQISSKSVQWKPSCSMWTDGQKDRQDDANSRFSNFCEHA